MKGFLITLYVLFSLVTVTFVIVKAVELKQNCTGYLKQAADANTVETAQKQLNKAIIYLEEHNLTQGYTSVLYKTPDEDIAFWYQNLKASEKELAKVDSTTSSLEKTNVLMKLRETLLDNSKDGDEITVPDGLSRYPDNMLWGTCLWIVILGAIALGGLSIFED